MPSFVKALNSQVGRKAITAISGIALMLFLVSHLAGNLTLFGATDAFNIYTRTLENMGWLLYLAEAGLLFLFLYHAIIGISIWRNRRAARGSKYAKYESKGKPSHYNLASRSMALTGVIILVFLVIHLWSFKFGATETIMIDGEPARDLKKLVVEKFTTPSYAFGYTAVLLIFILHLAHGFWSSFTTLGMRHGNFSHKMQLVAYGFAILLMLGFIFIPLYIYFTGGVGSLIK